MGRASIVARAGTQGTVLASAHAESPVRLVRPTFHGTSAAAVCVTTFGGGLVDGDRIDLEITVEPGATLLVFTQATTKAFRGSSWQRVAARVEGTLVFLPDPVAAFANARFTQRIDVSLEGAAARAVVLDGFTSGRPAHGDRWAMDALDLVTTIRRGERVLVRDALQLARSDGDVAARCGRFEAFATLVSCGAPSIERAMTTGVVPPSEDLVVAASALPRGPGAILRAAATSPSRVLAAVRERLRNLPDIDAVDPFVSRY